MTAQAFCPVDFQPELRTAGGCIPVHAPRWKEHLETRYTTDLVELTR